MISEAETTAELLQIEKISHIYCGACFPRRLTNFFGDNRHSSTVAELFQNFKVTARFLTSINQDATR